MTIEDLLLRFHSDMVSVERLSENSASTYEECAKIFLYWLSKEQIKLAANQKGTNVKKKQRRL